jgi:hypothetical protein
MALLALAPWSVAPWSAAPWSAARAETIPVGIVPFAYADTSGEPRDQAAEHRARLAAFDAYVHDNLAKSEDYSVVTLNCGKAACTNEDDSADDMLAAARAAGAKLILVGSFHKQSTLLQWLQISAVAVETNKIVYSRLVTFRGDTDLAWQRMGEFVVAEFRNHHIQP